MTLDKFLGCIYGATIVNRRCESLFASMDEVIDCDGKFSTRHIAKKHKEICVCEGDAGNCVMMKIPALGLWNSIEPEHIVTFTDKCIEFARMTHLGTPAIVGGAIHAVVITTLAARSHAFVHVPTLLSYLYELAMGLEAKLPVWKDKISSEIINIHTYLYDGSRGNLGEQSPQDIASLFGGGTSYAPCSFGVSYAIFLKGCLNPDNPNPFSAVFEAVNAGGDTDTNACMVGALVGALHGMKAIPQELVDALPDKDEIRKRTEKFYEACKRGQR